MNSQGSRDINELKKQAIQYYNENSDILKRVEDSLNNLFYDSPYDVYGYLSEYFSKISKQPFFTKLNARKSTFFDSKCQPTFKLDFYCQVKNVEKKILSIDAPCFSHDIITESAKIQNIQEDDENRLTKLNELVNFLNGEITDLVRNFSPFDQEELDEKLRNLFKTKHDQIYQAFLLSLNLKAQSIVSQIDSIEGKKSKTPTSPKQKSKPRKQSQAPGANTTVFGDDLNILFNSNFYGSFIEPLISKSICICSSIVSNKPPFAIISELKNQVSFN
ncbi:unnamed protein product [Brachionus calyciflorus]|uniref:Uncharacterized protein n=1 Tax=Brachionus calyciflorus TaxID=104777 RepID=A0A813WGG9_9BILA|nr:unnamed protein product [Brachionus calyciflorus]